MQWDDWDGAGFDEAVAWAPGTWRDAEECWKAIRRLGIEISRGQELELVYAFVGHVDGDPTLEVCNAAGVCWDSDEKYVDADTITAATFAIIAENE